MPTYDYICDSCGHEFEAYESIKADPQTVCPECTETTLRRKIGAGAAILFKGSGFYQTDYRSESYKKGAAADKSSESKSSESKSSESKSSESKSSESKSSESKSSDTSSKPKSEAKPSSSGAAAS
jgi:putative FmdB family regulatory protein